MKYLTGVIGCLTLIGSFASSMPMVHDIASRALDETGEETTQCGDNVCNPRQTCDSVAGECACKPDFYGINCMFSQCGATSCNHHQDCVEMSSGEEECICKVGRTGISCLQDLNECLETIPKPCAFPGGYCENRWFFEGFYSCGCDITSGWKDGNTAPDQHGVTSCMDINECSAEEPPCHQHATCTNLVPGFHCTCNGDRVGDGKVACDLQPIVDAVEPCEMKNCDAISSYCAVSSTDEVPQCLCRPGFSQIRPDSKCRDIDECSNPSACPPGAMCQNQEGGFECLCKPGYNGGGDVCTDVDECQSSSACPGDLQCVNTEGSYECFDPTPAPTPMPTPNPTPQPVKPVPVPRPVKPESVETVSTIGGMAFELTTQQTATNTFNTQVEGVGEVQVSGNQVSFTAENVPGGQNIEFTIPLPSGANFEGTASSAAQVGQFIVAQLTAAANEQSARRRDLSFEEDGSGNSRRHLDSPGCDLFPDAPCNLSCCAQHDKCFDVNGCDALSWARTICEPALASGFTGAISLGEIGEIVCDNSLLFVSGKCSQCNSVAVACIAKGCSGIADVNSESCYDNICDTFYECPGDCPFISLDDNACCGCQEAGDACESPEACGDGVCDFDEDSENCYTDCAFSEGCDETTNEISCGDVCIDPFNDVNNCGACGITCPSNVTGIADACILGSCTAPVDLSWTTSDLGLLGGGGWVITNDGKTIRYNIEDSANCNGTNSNIQTGFAEATITISQPFALRLDIIGIAELHDADFELMTVSLNDQDVVSATATDLDLGCAMGPSQFTEIAPGPYDLTTGEHKFAISFTTNDELYHVGAFYELNLVFLPV